MLRPTYTPEPGSLVFLAGDSGVERGGTLAGDPTTGDTCAGRGGEGRGTPKAPRRPRVGPVHVGRAGVIVARGGRRPVTAGAPALNATAIRRRRLRPAAGPRLMSKCDPRAGRRRVGGGRAGARRAEGRTGKKR